MRGSSSIATTALVGVLALGCQLNPGALGDGGGGDETGASSATSTDPTGMGTATTAASMSGSATGDGTTAGDPTDPTTEGPQSTTTEGSDETNTEGSEGSSSDSGSPSDCTPILVEALTSLDGGDDGREWVVLYNPCAQDYDLGPLTLAWGEFAYDGAVDLVGTISAGQCFVIGGPQTNGGNFDPSYAQVENFTPNLSREPGAIGLFLLEPGEVDVNDIPVDVVIYGNSNGGNFRDPTGAVPGPVVGGAVDLHSLRRTSLGNTWEYIDPPTPNDCPSF